MLISGYRQILMLITILFKKTKNPNPSLTYETVFGICIYRRLAPTWDDLLSCLKLKQTV